MYDGDDSKLRVKDRSIGSRSLGHADCGIDLLEARLAAHTERAQTKVRMQWVSADIGLLAEAAAVLTAEHKGLQLLVIDKVPRVEHHQRRSDPPAVARVSILADATLEARVLSFQLLQSRS